MQFLTPQLFQEPEPQEPAPEQPVAEGMDVNNVLANIEKEVRQQAGHDDWELIQIKLLDAALNMVGRDKRPVYEPDVLNVMNWDDAAEFLNTVARDAGEFENTDMTPPPGAMESEESVEEMVHRIVHQHFNEDNPNGGPFPKGEEGIAIEVKTEVEDVHGEEAALAAEEMARAEMAKCAAEWDEKHNGGGQDGLSRIREIISKMEKSMEGIGDQGHSGKDFNKNIMPAEEGYNPNSVDAEHRRDLEASHEKRLKDKAASGDKGAQARLDALAQKKELMKNNYNDRMERESTEMAPPAMEEGKFVVWYMIDDGEWDNHGTFNNEADATAYIGQLVAKGYDDDNFEVLKPGQHPDDDYAYTKDIGVGPSVNEELATILRLANHKK